MYLDPPFNSNRNYAAPVGQRRRRSRLQGHLDLSDLDVAWMGLIADRHPAIYMALDTAGLSHGKAMQSLPVHDGGAFAGNAPDDVAQARLRQLE